MKEDWTKLPPAKYCGIQVLRFLFDGFSTRSVVLLLVTSYNSLDIFLRRSQRLLSMYCMLPD